MTANDSRSDETENLDRETSGFATSLERDRGSIEFQTNRCAGKYTDERDGVGH